jgi:SAM-dependent methyltransferase
MTQVDILSETQEQRDAELSAYSGRTVQELSMLVIGDPAGHRVHEGPAAPQESYNHLYEDCALLDPTHYLRTLAARAVLYRGRFLRQLLKHVGSVENKRVVDYGCGTGTHGICCAQRGARVTFYDVDGPLSRYARYRAEARGLDIEFRLVGSPLGRYDLAICLDVLEHVAKPEVVLKQITRSLPPGGILCLHVGLGVNPDVGHFASSIKRWRNRGRTYLHAHYRRIGNSNLFRRVS